MNGWKITFLFGWPIFRGELLVLGSVHGTFPIFSYNFALFGFMFVQNIAINISLWGDPGDI